MSEANLYLVKLLIGNAGVSGAPVVHFTGAINAPKGLVNGSAEITQSVSPPHGHIDVPHVDGVIRHTGFGPDKRLVTLQGTYVVSVPPPAIGTYLGHFQAAPVVDKGWNGTASITFDGKTINDLPVKNEGGSPV